MTRKPSGLVLLATVLLLGIVVVPASSSGPTPAAATTASASELWGDGSDGSLTVTGTSYTDNIRTGVQGTANIGQSTVPVFSTTGFAPGQEVLILQVQGSTAGEYEFGTIAGVGSNSLTLQGNLVHSYVGGGPYGVTLYRQPNYDTSDVYETFWAGFHFLGERAIGNDTVSSLKVPTGFVARLYLNLGYNGTEEIFTTDDPNLAGNPIGDNAASSLKVIRTAVSSVAQVIRVPHYTDVQVQSGGLLTAHNWDGATGGVVCFRAWNVQVASGGRISISGADGNDLGNPGEITVGGGFRGGSTPQQSHTNHYGSQGESPLGMGSGGTDGAWWRANSAGGGGGIERQSDHSTTGGGGGGYANPGNQPGSAIPGGNQSEGGLAIGEPELTHLFLGAGGGGAGMYYNRAGSGGSGGGIVFVHAKYLTVEGNMQSDGGAGGEGGNDWDNGGGGGGGGAGGSIKLVARTATLGSSKVTAHQGPGGDGYHTAGGWGSIGRIRVEYGTLSGTTDPSASTQYLLFPPPAPTLYAIGNLDGDGNYLIDWSDAVDAASYMLQEDDNSAFVSPTTIYQGAGSQTTISGQSLGTWYYRVLASNTAGDSLWSAVQSVQVTVNLPPAPTLQPINNSDGNGSYLVDWSDIADATGYTLEEDDNSSFSTPSVIYQGSVSQFGINGRAVGTWHYRVLASNDAGDSPWSNVRSATVVDRKPTAFIEGINPNPAMRGVDTVHFTGSGRDNDEGGSSIATYHWHSSLDGDLSSDASFSIPAADLSAGDHTIAFQVMDDEDTWSDIVTESLVIQNPPSPPTAYIDSIIPNPATQGHDTITFVGHGVDSDESGASIVAYEWTSDVDGILSDQASFSQAASDLALGVHTIGFKVQDDEGEWSSQATTTLTVEPEVGTSWTVMLYFDGDNNLSIELNNALQRLEQSIAYNPYVNLLVLFDRDGTNNTYRYLVQPGGVYQDGVNRWYLGELNMGAQQTLIDFVTWSMQNYPADHTYLSIVDHGRGAHGIAKDGSNGGDSLETQELRAALGVATNAGTNKIDVVQYDACSMGLLENAYQIREYADYLVMSQNVVWSAFAYDSYLDGVTGTTTPEDLALEIASVYHNHPGVSSKPHTISVLDLSQAAATKDAADTLAIALRTAMVTPPIPTHVQNARNVSQKFDSGNQNSWYRIDPYDEYVDLYHFAERAKTYVPDSSVDLAADAVMAAVSTDGTGLVMKQYHRSGYYTGPDSVQIYWDLDNAHGVSIFFPQASNSQDYARYMSHAAFVFTGATQWDEFLSDYWGLLGLPAEEGNDGGYGETLLPGYRVFLPLTLKAD